MSAERRLYELWMKKTTADAPAQAELTAIAEDTGEINDRFYRDLAFGTAGLRGILGMGNNRMNRYVVGRAAQGLARYIGASANDPSAAVAYDSRNYSKEFARHTACVLAANGVKVYLFRELMPTPALSYAVRELGCDTGVVITASHNPAAYNGFKAYGPDGCQIGPEQADAVQKEILTTDLFDGVAALDFSDALTHKKIEYIPDSFVEQFQRRVLEEALEPQVCAQAGLKLVYTPLNGAGRRCVTAVLRMAGVKNITVVPEQEHPDGDFPTCPTPNPETPAAMELGLALGRELDSDLLLATDPDCDRVSVAARDSKRGDFRILSGNELGILLLDYICKTRARLGTMPQKPVAVRSLVSSRMADIIAEAYGAEMRVVLTGFKFIGEVIATLEGEGRGESFLFGFEESCGYLSGPYARDKDAVGASLLAAEMASALKLQGKTLIDALEELYRRFGVWSSVVDNFAFAGAAGMEKMESIMRSLRDAPPASLAGDTVERALDYAAGTEITPAGLSPAPLPKADMIELVLAGGNSVIVRPSGTEPKIKVYYTITGKTRADVAATVKRYRAAGLVRSE